MNRAADINKILEWFPFYDNKSGSMIQKHCLRKERLLRNLLCFNIQLGVKSTHFNASTLVSINLVTEDIQGDVSGWVARGEDENFIFMRG